MPLSLRPVARQYALRVTSRLCARARVDSDVGHERKRLGAIVRPGAGLTEDYKIGPPRLTDERLRDSAVTILQVPMQLFMCQPFYGPLADDPILLVEIFVRLAIE